MSKIANGDEEAALGMNSTGNSKQSAMPLASKQLSLLSGVAVIVGIMIGSGIFVAPNEVYLGTQSIGVSLIVWLLSGILSTIGAICYAELGTTIKRSGGDYAYLYVCFGPMVAFLRLWVALMILRPTLQAIMALTFALYVTKPFCDDVPNYLLRSVATCCLCLLTFVNCFSVRLAMKVQTVFTIGKLMALIFIVVAGFIYMFSGHYENFSNPFEGKITPSTVTDSLYAGLYAFGGWNYLNFVSEELKNPYKNLPRAIWISLPIVTIIYFFTNVSYFAVLGPEELKGNEIAQIFGNKLLPAGISWIIPLFVALSTFGSINGTLYTSSVLFSIGSQEGQLPKFLSFYHAKRNTPIPSIVFTCLTSISMLFYSDIKNLIDYVMQIFWLSIAVSLLGLIRLRFQKPELERPIRNHIALPIFSLLFSTFLFLYPFVKLIGGGGNDGSDIDAIDRQNSRNNIVISSGLIAIGAAIYIFVIKRKSRFEFLDTANERLTQLLQNWFDLREMQTDAKQLS